MSSDRENDIQILSGRENFEKGSSDFLISSAPPRNKVLGVSSRLLHTNLSVNIFHPFQYHTVVWRVLVHINA